MEKLLEDSLLYDFYSEMLTDHQRQVYQDFVRGEGPVETERLALRHQSGNLGIVRTRAERFLEIVLCIYLKINM